MSIGLALGEGLPPRADLDRRPRPLPRARAGAPRWRSRSRRRCTLEWWISGVMRVLPATLSRRRSERSGRSRSHACTWSNPSAADSDVLRETRARGYSMCCTLPTAAELRLDKPTSRSVMLAAWSRPCIASERARGDAAAHHRRGDRAVRRARLPRDVAERRDRGCRLDQGRVLLPLPLEGRSSPLRSRGDARAVPARGLRREGAARARRPTSWSRWCGRSRRWRARRAQRRSRPALRGAPRGGRDARATRSTRTAAGS